MPAAAAAALLGKRRRKLCVLCAVLCAVCSVLSQGEDLKVKFNLIFIHLESNQYIVLIPQNKQMFKTKHVYDQATINNIWTRTVQ